MGVFQGWNAVSWWGYQDLNLGPLPYQVCFSIDATCVTAGGRIYGASASDRNNLPWFVLWGMCRARRSYP